MSTGMLCSRLALAALLLLCASWSAAQEELADVRILIDVSGSMKQNDPQNLRRPALRLLVGLLPAQTRAGVWTFGRYVNMQIPLGQVDSAWKTKARKSSESIGSPGQFTNIEEALKRATDDWAAPAPGYRRSVILLTDGMVDISKQAGENAESRERIRQQILPRLRAGDARIYTIALSKNADHRLMRELAESTGGWYEQAENADQLQKVFLRIFEKVGRPDTVPLKDNKFTIDDSITEATVLVFHKPDAQPTEVIPPDGKAFGADTAPGNVQWARDQGYDMLTISEPASGEWKIRAEVDPENRVMVVTDLKMRTSELPNRLMLGQTLPFDVSFTDHGRIITKPAFLQVVAVTALQTDPAGEREPRPLQDDGGDEDAAAGDGRFSMRFGGDNLSSGRGELVITAEGRTFVREKRMTYDVSPPVNLQLTPDESGQQLLLEASADPELIDPASLQASIWLMDATDDRQAVELTAEAGIYRGAIDLTAFSGSRQLVIEAGANALNGEAIRFVDTPAQVEGLAAPVPAPAPPAETAPEPPPASIPEPPPPPEETGWVGAGLWFAAMNLAFLAGGGALFWWLRRRRLRNRVQLVDEEGTRVIETTESGDSGHPGEKPA